VLFFDHPSSHRSSPVFAETPTTPLRVPVAIIDVPAYSIGTHELYSGPALKPLLRQRSSPVFLFKAMMHPSPPGFTMARSLYIRTDSA